MELKDFMESCVCYLNLSREKQQYAAGLIRWLALSEQIEKDKHLEAKEQKIC